MKKRSLLLQVICLLWGSAAVAQPVAFRHTSAVGNISNNFTILDHASTNDRPNALLFATTDYGSSGPYHDKVIGVWYNNGRWTIFNQDRGTMPQGVLFNVLVVEPGDRAFVHRASTTNTTGHVTYIDHPRLNGNARARLLVAQNWGSAGPYNNNAIGVYYDNAVSGGRWAIFNQNRQPMPAGAQFNVWVEESLIEVEATAPSNNFCAITNAAADNQPNAILVATQYWTSVYNANEIGVWFNAGKWYIFNQSRQPMPRGAKFFVHVAGASRPTPTPSTSGLRGWVDLHTHPMSYLGFGRKAMHGAPDIGCIVPAGTRDCNPTEFRARTPAEALGHCNSTHGGWGTDNGCGDYLRAAIINFGVDAGFKYKSDNPHGDHHHAGFPDFPYWPHHSSKLHQQMWWEWIKRAYDGGLRVMVALTVNSELLAEIINGDPPYDDKTVADLQIDETVAFVNRHRDFMEIAYSAADVRRIVGQDKLAVVLGMEVDRWGNFGRPGVPANDETVRAEIRRLYNKGVRYFFPVHLIDNPFGGAAVYSMLFNFANKHANGRHFAVESSTGRNIAYRANVTDGPLGLENGLILGLRGVAEGIGQLPAPCFNDAIKCSPPPGKVRCCGSYEKVLNILSPGIELDAYKFVAGGHVNTLGLTRLGEVAITEMMRLGMLIDIDHMSEKAQWKAIELAERVQGRYPLFMGHNGIRGAQGNERNAHLDMVRRLSALGGMFGVGTAHTTPDAFVQNYRAVWDAMGRRAVGIGTDVNGFEPLPYHLRPNDAATSARFYEGFFREYPNIRSRSGITGSTRQWDYIREGGVSHYGLMPEFLYDVKTSTGGADVVENLMTSAEHFAQVWEQCERVARNVSAAPTGGDYTYNLAALTNLCPFQLVAGDREFGGNGPRITGSVTLRINPSGSTLQAVITFTAKETGGDGSEVRGSWTLDVGEPAPVGLRYERILSPTTSTFDRVLQGGGRNEAFEGCDGGEHVVTPADGPVTRMVVVGDTGGADISHDADCNCDTRIVRIEFRPIQARLVPR